MRGLSIALSLNSKLSLPEAIASRFSSLSFSCLRSSSFVFRGLEVAMRAMLTAPALIGGTIVAMTLPPVKKADTRVIEAASPQTISIASFVCDFIRSPLVL